MRQQFCYWMLALAIFLWIHSHTFYSNYEWRGIGPNLRFSSAGGLLSIERAVNAHIPYSAHFMNATVVDDWLSSSPTWIGLAFSFGRYEWSICIPCWMIALFWLYGGRMAPSANPSSGLSSWIIAVSFVGTGIVLSSMGFMAPLIAITIVTTLTTFVWCLFLRVRSLLREPPSCHPEVTSLRIALFALALILWSYSYLHQGIAIFDSSSFHSQVGRSPGLSSISYHWIPEFPSDGLFVQEDYEWFGSLDDIHNVFPSLFGIGMRLNDWSFVFCLPYWLFALLWLPWRTLLHSKLRFQFRVIHLLELMTFVAIVVVCVTNRLVLILDLTLHLATLTLIAVWLWREMRRVAINLWQSFFVDSKHIMLPSSGIVGNVSA